MSNPIILPTLPVPEVLSEVQDAPCPTCGTMIRAIPPIRLGYTADQMHAHAAAVSAADNAALQAEVALLREFVEHVRRNGGTHLANMAIAVLAARKGEA